MADVVSSDFRARIFHPEDLERVHDQRRAALAAGVPFEFELRALSKEGQYRWFLIRYKPFHDEQGRLVSWYATGTDIDDRKRAEDRTRNENVALREEIVRSSMFEEIVGSSDALRTVLAQIAKVAPTDSTVLIQGETGTGKELIARAIHHRSRRGSRAFIRVNCAAIRPRCSPPSCSGTKRARSREHSRDASVGLNQRTAARSFWTRSASCLRKRRSPCCASCKSGIRTGRGNQPILVDVRVLAATNKDLTAAVRAGTSARSVLPAQCRSHPGSAASGSRGDIPLLVEYLVERYAQKAGKRIRRISKDTLDLFEAYHWPGNIRELQNVIERAVILSDGDVFRVDASWLTPAPAKSPVPGGALAANLAQRERAMIEAALREAHGVIGGATGAAAKLGLPRQTLESKMSKLGIDRYRFKSS